MTTTTRPLVLMYHDSRTLVQAAADRVVELAQQAIAERGRFTWALSGGTTPRDLYVLLGEAPIDWQRVYFFWSDERCVPPEHNESNYGMLQTTLLKRANPPASNVHRMRGEPSHVIFLVFGASKTARLKQALADMPQGEALPVQLIRPSRGELLWMIDHDAAAELEDRDRLAALPTELRADGD